MKPDAAPHLPKRFVDYCRSITAKRPKTVIEHILRYGQITTEELKDIYGYNHPPRAVRDVRETGIPIATFKVTGKDGRKIAAYRLGNIKNFGTESIQKFKGRTAFTKRLKEKLLATQGERCAIYLEPFDPRFLQIDHRIPYEVSGDDKISKSVADNFMLICPSANRAKSWACEHCENWLSRKKPDICKKCYCAFPENYEHIAMKQERRLDVMWSGKETSDYGKLKRKADEKKKEMPAYVKEIVKRDVNT